MHEGLYSKPIILIFAYILDIVIGDPKWLPHPVRVMGWGITKMEGLLRDKQDTGCRIQDSGYKERLRGILLVVTIVGSTYMVFYMINSFLTYHSSPITFLFLIYLTSTTLATHELIKSTRSVINSLKANNINDARRNLSYIVGRDTERLNEEGILRATIETLAENISDGIIAPLFYFVVGGLPLAMSYKAVNTLDSMVGYKNERYKDFGWASARLDDIANYIPARITGVLILISTLLITAIQNPVNALRITHRALRIMLRDGRNHPSPNSGFPESAMAGALCVKLGGPSYYGGVLVEKPYIGDEINETEDLYSEASVRALVITGITSLLGFIIAVITLYIKIAI